MDSEIKLVSQESNKLQDPIVYTDGSITEVQSGWGFSVKQGVTTIHENSAAYIYIYIWVILLKTGPKRVLLFQ